MIQEMAFETGASLLVILSMLLFLAIFVAIVVRTWRKNKAQMDAHARLPLEDQEPEPGRDPKDPR